MPNIYICLDKMIIRLTRNVDVYDHFARQPSNLRYNQYGISNRFVSFKSYQIILYIFACNKTCTTEFIFFLNLSYQRFKATNHMLSKSSQSLLI